METKSLPRQVTSLSTLLNPPSWCYVTACHSTLPAASLGTSGGHNSVGPSSACCRPILQPGARAVLTSSSMAPLTVAGGQGKQCWVTGAAMVRETDTKWASLTLYAWDLAVLSLYAKQESRATAKERCGSQWLLFAFCNDDVMFHFG